MLAPYSTVCAARVNISLGFILEWEGGDEWIRAQFKEYLQSLMATVLAEGNS